MIGGSSGYSQAHSSSDEKVKPDAIENALQERRTRLFRHYCETVSCCNISRTYKPSCRRIGKTLHITLDNESSFVATWRQQEHLRLTIEGRLRCRRKILVASSFGETYAREALEPAGSRQKSRRSADV